MLRSGSHQMPEILVDNPEATSRLAALISPHLAPGDVVGLVGDLGAGKSHFARALIATRLAALGRREEIPSPSFTLVQTYDLGDTEIWHVDLYRLGDPDEICELGIDDAFETCIVLVEWIDRVGTLKPDRVLRIELDFDNEDQLKRWIRLTPTGEGWDWLPRVLGQMELAT